MSQLGQLLKSHTDKSGLSLYEHLNQLLFQLTQGQKDKHATQLESFELLSDFLKKNRYVYKAPPSDHQVNNFREVPAVHDQWASLVTSLLKSQGVKQIPTILPNFINDARAFEIAGYGFGEEESYLIQQSLRRLAEDTKVKELYFWGKYLTNGKDYYVARGVTHPLPSDPLPPNGEARGTGVNYYTFWVCHDVLGDWQELPLITPHHIQVARQIKHVCTGNLDANLNTYPSFPGKEKHYLKAQIVRITHANVIVPKGLYKPNEEDAKQVEFEDEFKLPEFADFANLENWVHLPPQILKLGRITHWVDPQLSEEAKQAKQDELNENDPEVERLKAISEDKPFEPYETGWLVKTAGDMQIFNPAKDDQSAGVYGVTILRNHLWPGAVTVAYRSSFANLYIGYGNKLNQATFEPIAPSDLQEEPEEQEEHHEPNPKNAPVAKVVEQAPEELQDPQD